MSQSLNNQSGAFWFRSFFRGNLNSVTYRQASHSDTQIKKYLKITLYLPITIVSQLNQELNMRKQVELKYFIGYNVANPDADAAMIQAACAVCGGCFVADGTGYWVNGDTHAERFDGEAESEHCLNICLTTELEKLEGVIQFMEFEIARIVHDHGCEACHKMNTVTKHNVGSIKS